MANQGGILVLLHGYQDDPGGLESRLSPLLEPGRWVVVSPRAPTMMPAGPVWFTTDEQGADEGAVVVALGELDELIDRTSAEHGLPRSAVVVGGSSQGGAMALALGAQTAGATGTLGGLFCVSGWLPHFDTITYDLAGLGAASTPCLIVHGDDDDVVIVQQGRSGARLLERHGVPVTYVEVTGGGHHLGQAADAPVVAWLSQLSL